MAEEPGKKSLLHRAVRPSTWHEDIRFWASVISAAFLAGCLWVTLKVNLVSLQEGQETTRRYQITQHQDIQDIKQGIDEIRTTQRFQTHELSRLSKMGYYKVTDGDSLFLISQKLHVNLDALLQLNPEITDPQALASGSLVRYPILAQNGPIP
jgi:hypothetical protein